MLFQARQHAPAARLHVCAELLQIGTAGDPRGLNRSRLGRRGVLSHETQNAEQDA
jgi:hypothetical protein